MTVVVFDCMVYLQAATNGSGASAACLEVAERREVRLVYSDATHAEVADILTRPKIRRKFPHLTDELVADFLRRVERIAGREPEPPELVTLTRDPKKRWRYDADCLKNQG